jgi:hypothetical protein
MRCWQIFAVMLMAAAPAAAQTADCDENNPNGPMRSAQVTLTAADAIDATRAELRSFVDTGSLGRVDATLVAATPPGLVRGVSATPHLSRLSPDFPEQLKGIEVVAALNAPNRSARIVVRLSQVCAQTFRDTFLSQ